MKRILVLCHGNVNRSALCGAILEQELAGVAEVRSAGFIAGGRRAAKKTRDAAMQGYDIDLENHRSTQVDAIQIAWADTIIYMDKGNLGRLERIAGQFGGQRWHCLGEFAEPAVKRIPDPAFMARGTPEFEATIALIVSASENLAKKVIAADEETAQPAQ
jgi:protein-tyrosine-phosphatase